MIVDYLICSLLQLDAIRLRWSLHPSLTFHLAGSCLQRWWTGQCSMQSSCSGRCCGSRTRSFGTCTSATGKCWPFQILSIIRILGFVQGFWKPKLQCTLQSLYNQYCKRTTLLVLNFANLMRHISTGFLFFMISIGKCEKGHWLLRFKCSQLHFIFW